MVQSRHAARRTARHAVGLRVLGWGFGAFAAAVVGIALWTATRAPFAPAERMSAQAESSDLLAAVAVPTLGEWGMLFATLSLLAAGTTVIIRRRR